MGSGFRVKETLQGHQHAGGGAPDEIALPGHGPVFAAGAAYFDALALVVGCLSSRNSSGGSKTSATSKSSSFRFSGGVTRPTTGVTTKPVPVRYSGRRPRISTWDGQCRLPLRPRARRWLRARRRYFAASAGKADLAGMVAQMRGALGQQHGGPVSRTITGTSTAAGTRSSSFDQGRFADGGRDDAFAESTSHQGKQASARIRACMNKRLRHETDRDIPS
jgi:hypothetical protein